MKRAYDVFISHATADKTEFILPLVSCLEAKGIKYCPHSIEVTWGDSITMKINEGLRLSEFVLICLSKNFLARTWPESEMGSALAIQNSSGIKRVLPLILNSKNEVLEKYPLLADKAFREYSVGPTVLADELAALLETSEQTDKIFRITVESIHSGRSFELEVNPRASIKWLSQMAQSKLGAKEFADAGAAVTFKLRWVLVDVKAEDKWKKLSRSKQRKLRALIMSDSGYKSSFSDLDRLADIGVYDGAVFHMYAVEDEEYFSPSGGSSRSGGGGAGGAGGGASGGGGGGGR